MRIPVLVVAAVVGLPWNMAHAQAPTAEAEGLAYEVTFEGPENVELEDLVRRSSQLLSLAARPPASVASLARRAERDVERFRTVLRAEGFYAGAVSHEIDAVRVPAQVTVSIAPGPAYVLSRYDIRFDGEGAQPTVPSLADLGIVLGERAESAAIVQAGRRLRDRLADVGRPFATRADRRVMVDHDTRTVSVTETVNLGPPTRFGAVTFEGLERVREDFLRRRLPWRAGEPYDRSQVEAYRAALLGTGLFDSVSIDGAVTVAADGTLPVAVTVQEAAARSVGAGAAYDSSEGVSGSVFWEHRNILGRDEDLRLELNVGEIEQSVGGTFTKPDFLRREQDLLTDVTLRRTASDAFNELAVAGAASLQWPVNDHVRGSWGLSLEVAELEDGEGERTSTLVGAPVAYSYDDTDDPLNPTTGARARVGVTPYVGRLETPVEFVVGRAGGSAYQALDEDGWFVIAGRAEFGVLFGEPTETVPANRRFYAGGGGSIRGFDFQQVGPLDGENEPVGGRSVVELGAELRIRVTETIGLVPFVEGGNVYDDSVPDFSPAPRWAAGIGARYFTAVGPLRLDVAFPINRREGIDDTFEFYISLGQAF